MSKPFIHAESSTRRWGGVPGDYLDIHQLLDSSKSTLADNRHRALTHNSWFISVIIERIFGVTRVNSTGRTYSTRDVAEQHVIEDFGGKFIPAASDYLSAMEFEDWMQNGKKSVPPSYARIQKHRDAQKLEQKFVIQD